MGHEITKLSSSTDGKFSLEGHAHLTPDTHCVGLKAVRWQYAIFDLLFASVSKMCCAYRFSFTQNKIVFIRKVLHRNSFWNADKRQLGNGLLCAKAFAAMILHYNCQICNLCINFWTQIISNQQEFIQLEIKDLVSNETINQLRNSRSTVRQSTIDGAHSTIEENQVVDHEMYLHTMARDRNWEVPRERLVITEETLGGGEFGIVNKGIYLRKDGSELPVAVKGLKG